MDRLARLADLVGQRSTIDREISAILGRPVHSGHFGEYVAGVVFGIDLNPSASARSHDGNFNDGALAGKTVNVKYATKRHGLLNLAASENLADHPDFYLVMTGPRVAPATSRGTVAPWVIHAVYLFESRQLLAVLATRGVRPGTATSVRRGLWEAAMVYPEARNQGLLMSEDQREALALFAGDRE